MRWALWRWLAGPAAHLGLLTGDRQARNGLGRRVLLLGVALTLVVGGALWALSVQIQRGVATSRGDAASIPSALAPKLRPFYTQTITWTDCGSDAQCGWLAVPFDYADPAAGTIQLDLVRRPATEPASRIGSLVVNPGGPGFSGVAVVRDHADGWLTQRLRSRFDLVGFDPRGVGQSAPIRCGASAPVDSTPDDPAEVDRYVAALRAAAAACRAESGVLLGHVSTVETARDLDILRATLGDPRLNYLGWSYGTYLGTRYAELFPERIGRLVLDSVVDGSLSQQDSLRGQAAGFEAALQQFLADCTETADCAIGTGVPAARQRLTELLTGLDQRPLRVGETPVDRDRTLGAISAALYSRASWPRLARALGSALAGDGAALIELSETGFPFAGNSAEALLAITCLDQPPAFRSASEVLDALPAFRQASPTFGEWLAWDGLRCAGWPVSAVDTPRAAAVISGLPPILLVANTRDPATPYTEAQAMAAQLDSSVLLTHDGDGHGVYPAGTACVDTAVDGFLVDGLLPGPGTRCT